eukprot:scaffold116874_cov49-Attheya_sp.AAC.1
MVESIHGWCVSLIHSLHTIFEYVLHVIRTPSFLSKGRRHLLYHYRRHSHERRTFASTLSLDRISIDIFSLVAFIDSIHTGTLVLERAIMSSSRLFQTQKRARFLHTASSLHASSLLHSDIPVVADDLFAYEELFIDEEYDHSIQQDFEKSPSSFNLFGSYRDTRDPFQESTSKHQVKPRENDEENYNKSPTSVTEFASFSKKDNSTKRRKPTTEGKRRETKDFFLTMYGMPRDTIESAIDHARFKPDHHSTIFQRNDHTHIELYPKPDAVQASNRAARASSCFEPVPRQEEVMTSAPPEKPRNLTRIYNSEALEENHRKQKNTDGPNFTRCSQKGASFAENVHAMITEGASTEPDIVQWIANGEAFTIHETGSKLGELLMKYFDHKKYSSLQRQLNMYGFKKCVIGKYTGGFWHPHFHRDHGTSDELAKIKRRAPPKPLNLECITEKKRPLQSSVALYLRPKYATPSVCRTQCPRTPITKTQPIAVTSPSKVKEKKSPLKKQTPFPESVHQMITEVALTHPNLVEWRHDGKAFVFHDTVGRALYAG